MILIFCLTALGLGLFIGDLWLALRDSRYNTLLQEFECGYYGETQPCKADFDGDGRLTHIEVKRHHDAPVELPPQFVGNEEQAVLKVFSLDNTLRTHVAVRNEMGRARLIVYDASMGPINRKVVNAVYAWDGHKLSETAAAPADKEILSAMAAREDAGTFNQWVLYYLVKWPLRLVYVSLFVVAALLYRRHSGVETMTATSG